MKGTEKVTCFFINLNKIIFLICFSFAKNSVPHMKKLHHFIISKSFSSLTPVNNDFSIITVIMQSHWSDCMPTNQLLEILPTFRELAFLTNMWPTETLWRHTYWSVLIKEMAFCQQAVKHTHNVVMWSQKYLQCKAIMHKHLCLVVCICGFC